jgi:phage FluMu protein gp41
MTTVKVTLIKGLKVGDVIHKEAEIREATAGDYIEAMDESERLCKTPEGNYVLLASPGKVSINTLRRQIVRIGEHAGPLTEGELSKLSASDLNRLQDKAMDLEGAAALKVGERGE